MADTIYFQWQNEYLLRTIYPLREVKLRDFLVAYYEIDIWKQYQSKTPQDIPAEITAYCAAQIQKIQAAVDDYGRLMAYLLDEDVTDEYQAKYPILDADMMAKINLLHKTFKTYYPNYKNPVQQKYFISSRVREFEDLHKTVIFQISEKQRILRNMGPTWALKSTYELAGQKLANISIKMVDQELVVLYNFLAAYGRLESYRQQASKIRAQKEKDRTDAGAKLAALKTAEMGLVSSVDAIAKLLVRLQIQPDTATLKTYFLDDDVGDVYKAAFPSPDPDVLLAVNNVHKAVKAWLPTYKNPTVERYFLGQRAKELEDLRARRQQDVNDRQRAAQYMPADWPNRAANDQAIQQLVNVSLKMIDLELNKLYDFLWAYDAVGKQPAEINALVAQKKQEQAALQSQLQANRADQAAQGAVMNAATALLNTPEKEQLTGLVTPAQVTVADVVRAKTEDYKAGLMLKNKDELLEEIVGRFTQEPGRYPLWLQYMVVHFSGMRYQTAHGSWADPKDLLLSLKTKFVGDEIRRAGEDSIESLCEQKFYLYKSQLSPGDPGRIQDDGVQSVPPLAGATELEWRAKIDYHLGRIDPASMAYKRRALLDFRVDEENYVIEKMTDQQVLDELDDLKDQIPDWMWKQIVQVTQLRLKEVSDANWENLSQADMDARWSSQMAQYRQIMDDWKAKYLTGWRKEHELTEDLVVTRAVCNEVAEHIQHVRGNNPGAGLSARPEWYLSQVRSPALAKSSTPPYFVKPKSAADFRPGASILYLRWVNKPPDPWNITRPLALTSGDDLVPAGEDAQSKITNTGSMYMRTTSVKVLDAKGNVVDTRTDTQWLRWMHEATVVEVAETVDGPTVYTFETALPFDDKRQATIGVFKHSAAELRYAVSPSVMQGVLCGYEPDGNIPFDRLQDKLNWNNILLRSRFSDAELAGLWKAIAKPAAAPVSFAAGLEDLALMEVTPPLKQRGYRPVVTCYEPSSRKKKMRRYWPQVELPRGMQVTVDRGAGIQTDQGVYYPVVECRLEPRAAGLYVRTSDLLEIPEEGGSQPVRLKKDSALHRLTRVGIDGSAVLHEADAFLPAGTRFRVSKIHCAGPRDRGDGLIHAQDGEDYYLIVDCPRRISAQGLLIRADAVKAIPEKQYAKKALILT